MDYYLDHGSELYMNQDEGYLITSLWTVKVFLHGKDVPKPNFYWLPLTLVSLGSLSHPSTS